ncbi:hypothetical protein V8G54_010701 [Vigna mungo]|uniref:Uncharacterized protein n=1 Tax=Vigna mungo TaxID=3915 RepID=A0AAQ3S6P5_VIGMU
MEPWEGLDIDDSDLNAFLHKCKSSATLIPGPAGNVQAAMLNRDSDEPKSTQEFVNEIAMATFVRDFKSNPWIWAEKFIKHHGLVEDGNMNNVTQLERVKSMHVLPFVACIVKECKPNGLGDMKIAVKVAVFSPNRRTHYLNITVWNVVKVFQANIGPPTDELLNASSRPDIRPHPCGKEPNNNTDVGPSDKACTYASNNASTTPMEDE